VLATALTLSITLSAVGTASPLQPARAARPSAGKVAQMLTADMTTQNKVLPHGVPPWYDWAKGPRPRRVAPPADFSAFTAWGQLYRCADSAFDADDTIQMRDLQTWLLVDGRWRRVQRSSALGGSAFAEDYARPSVAARVVARRASGTRVRMREGYNFHFWPGRGRVALDPRRVGDVAVVVSARRIRHGASAGCFVLSVGADYWRSRTASAGATNVSDAGIGRFKRVGRRWRAFSMTTASADTLSRHPLPLRLPARELW
jgi:hypothetical protein